MCVRVCNTDLYVCILCLRQAQKIGRASRALCLLLGLRQANIVEGDPCGICNYVIINNVSTGSWLMNLLNLVAPIGWGPPASRIPAHKWCAPELGFPHRAGRYRPGRSPFLSPVCWICRCIEGFMTRGWEITLPGWRWFREPQYNICVSASRFCVCVS